MKVARAALIGFCQGLGFAGAEDTGRVMVISAKAGWHVFEQHIQLALALSFTSVPGLASAGAVKGRLRNTSPW